MKLVAGALFFLVTLAVYGLLAPLVPSGVPMILAYPLVLLLSFASTLVHELGHAAAAWSFGGHVRQIVVLPFAWWTDKKRLGWAKKLASAEIGGFVAYSLDRIEARRKHMLIALAGPLANLAFAIVILAAISLIHAGSGGSATGAGMLPDDHAVADWTTRVRPTRIEAVLKALAMLSMGAGLVNLIPFTGSDGHVILRGLRSWRNQSR